MKLIKVGWLSALVFLAMMVMPSSSYAVPYNYTFSGNVTTVDDTAGLFAAKGITAGSAVSFTFTIDFAAAGTITDWNANTNTLIDDSTTDFFYTDYVGGSAVDVTGGVTETSQPYTRREYNYGYQPATGSGYGWIFGQSDDDWIQISNLLERADSWVVGTTGFAGNQVLNTIGADAYGNSVVVQDTIQSELTLTSIQPVQAVPEPSTFLLMATGLLGLLAFNRKRTV